MDEADSSNIELPYDYEVSMAELCQLLGVTENTIRNYDKLDAIFSRRRENGYRFYYFNDIQQVLMMKAYTSMGLSIREASHITKQADLAETETVLTQMISRMDEDIKRIQMQQRFLDEMREALRHMGDCFEKIYTSTRPALYWLDCHENGHLRRDAAFRAALKEWTEHVPFVQSCNVISKDDLQQQTVVKLGYCIRASYADVMPASALSAAVFYPERPCLATVVRANVRVPDYYSVIGVITRYMQEMHVELDDDMICGPIVTDTLTPWDRQTCYDYYLCYFCVK